MENLSLWGVNLFSDMSPCHMITSHFLKLELLSPFGSPETNIKAAFFFCLDI